MTFDGIFTRAITNEFTNELENGRISKIYQPFKNELLIQIRANGKNHKLLLSAHPSYARAHITNESYDNPSEPPMFCMLLRKHLEGSIIEKISQIDVDRIIVFDIKGRNEIGDVSYKQLIIEIMGRHSNIILLDKDKQTILDSIKHISPAVNRHRTILPGHTYVAPPAQLKSNPFLIDLETFLSKIDFNAGKLDQQIVAKFSGISPLFAKEVVYRTGIANRKSLPISFLSMMDIVKANEISAQIITKNGKEYFYILPLSHLEGNTKTFSTISEMLDRFYFGKAERDRVKQQGNDLERFISNEKAKNEKKIKKLKTTLQESEKAERFKLFGELLTANMYVIKRGDKVVEVQNYYSPDNEVMKIELHPQKTPSENAQSYFLKYQKAKKSVAFVENEIRKAVEEISYFDALLQQIDSAAPKDLQEIREELMEEGYLRSKFQKGNKKNKPTKPIIEKYESSDGTEILVGKNNKQNEYLTNKFAGKDDIWLHTKDIPGSHVVIRSKTPTEETIIEAATIAAYFSKAKNSSSVPVDFTLIRYVKKPNGSKPGYVTYDNQQTVYVTPDEDLILKLRK
ncbi:Rqc2 family fibronectin-binding protein [Ferdinandcohnia quinoae]|uniref:Rqc2 homolog RqcH n=1 Tax=Fredinandcohnia quinoae TaxID=2918902 RepID=A0AAW5E1S8_9BACI|nr:NFACT RNA binding domain-containing protein [Fredinandcohnia sp. SECRCQ15]MCH1623842.1 NFACT RNA binding domain-containing protein [Fredinandcohnia sp. SECRCQ15]